MIVDLHIHSTHSDGSLSVSEIIARARHTGLAAISITDHDCINGAKEVLTSVDLPPRLKFLPGVEISAAAPPGFPLKGSLHILGYGFDVDNDFLNETLSTLQQARENRNPQIISRLQKLGVAIDKSEISAIAGNSSPGRPHIAQALVHKKIVASIEEAFRQLLGNGRPAYVDKYRIEAEKAIEVIRQAGGIPILAHPYLIGDHPDPTRIETLVEILMEMGIGGIEVYYPEHSDQQTTHLATLARQKGLLMTGGSDFHGDINAQVEMGIGTGSLQVPLALYQKLVEAIQESNRDSLPRLS